MNANNDKIFHISNILCYYDLCFPFNSAHMLRILNYNKNIVEASYGGKAAHSWQRWQLCAATATRRVEITVKVIVGNWHVLC